MKILLEMHLLELLRLIILISSALLKSKFLFYTYWQIVGKVQIISKNNFILNKSPFIIMTTLNVMASYVLQ